MKGLEIIYTDLGVIKKLFEVSISVEVKTFNSIKVFNI